MSKYNLVTLAPNMSHLFHAVGGANDILFDWQAVHIPKGTCIIKSISGVIAGIDGAADNASDIKLYYAKGINGVAPTTLGTAHAVTTDALASAFRRNILGFTFLDLSSIDDGTTLISYKTLGSRSAASGDGTADGGFNSSTMLQGDEVPFGGDANYSKTPEGYQTIWIAAISAGSAMDFGTEVDLNMGGHQAASVPAVQITTTGTDPRKVFQPGDLIQGHLGTVTAEVVSVDSATTMTVKNVSAQITQSEHLVLQKPIVLNLGLEY